MNSQNSPSEPTIDLRGLVHGWKTVLFTTVAAMVAGAALLMTITPQQQVSAKIIVESREVGMDGSTGAAARDKEFLPTQAEILQSPTVITDAVQRVSSKSNSDMLTNQILSIAENLKVDPLAGTSILLLRYTDVNAQHAADLVNALIASYSDYLATTEQQQHHEMMTALTGRDMELQNTLAKLQTEFDRFRQDNAAAAGADPVAMARIVASLEESLADIQSRRITLERAATRISAQGRNLVTKVPSTTTDTGLDHSRAKAGGNAVLTELSALNGTGWTGLPNPGMVEDRLRTAQARVAELNQTLGPHHPELQAAQSLVKTAEVEINRLVQTSPGILRQTLDSLTLQEEALKQRYESHVRMNRVNDLTRLRESQRLAEIQRAQEAYETVHARLQQWRMVDEAMANGRAGIAVSVLEPPTPGERSFVANPMIVIGVSGLLGLMFGVFLLIAIPQVKSLLLPQSSAPHPSLSPST